jgi:hypothetical protein
LQTAVAETVTAFTPVPSNTPYPTLTPQPTFTPFVITATPNKEIDQDYVNQFLAINTSNGAAIAKISELSSRVSNNASLILNNVWISEMTAQFDVIKANSEILNSFNRTTGKHGSISCEIT